MNKIVKVTFEDRFASDDRHNSFTLTADGCMRRFDQTKLFRENELNLKGEGHFGRAAMLEERTLMNYVSILAKKGKQPLANETIESFVIKNIDSIC